MYDMYDGTSMAAPHVSAVAGLMLSRYPNLTRAQVTDIIESTAQKIGNYEYETKIDRPNGEWNVEVGYGLVDAQNTTTINRSFVVQSGSQLEIK